MRYPILFIALLSLSACTGKRSGWADTLEKQIAQPNSITRVDTQVVNFMSKYYVPGMSMAISKNGKILYAKGYGYANKSKQTEVTTRTLFRMGRMSQLITAIATLQLIEKGKFSLDSKVFGDSGILGNQYGAPPYEAKITNITVNELLHHNIGGWAGYDDPAWNPKYLDKVADPGHMISFALENIPLRNSPGSGFAFSSLGYLILGRIIEKASGLPYSNFVKEKILNPLRITDMQIEGASADEIRSNEAIHYADVLFPILRSDRIDDDTYGYTALGDACYGWIASAEDILKIVNALEDSTQTTPILAPKTLKILFSTDKTNPYNGCGIVWNKEGTNWYFLGDYRGSSCEFAHAGNGYSWVILANTYRPAIDAYLSDMDQIFWNAIGTSPTGSLLSSTE